MALEVGLDRRVTGHHGAWCRELLGRSLCTPRQSQHGTKPELQSDENTRRPAKCQPWWPREPWEGSPMAYLPAVIHAKSAVCLQSLRTWKLIFFYSQNALFEPSVFLISQGWMSISLGTNNKNNSPTISSVFVV